MKTGESKREWSGAGLEALEPRLCMDGAWSEDYSRAVEMHAGRAIAITVDLDNDGDLDSVVWRKKALRVFRNDGDGPHALVQSVGMGRQPLRLAAGDFNGDGFTDIATIGSEPGAPRFLTLFRNTRQGTIARVTEVTTPAHTIEFVNAPGQGLRDRLLLLSSADATSELSLHRMRQGELLRLRPLVVSLGTIQPPAIADFDGDGRDDALLVVVSDRGMSSLLEVRLDRPMHGDPARQVFATSEFVLGGPVARQAGSENASGPGVAFVATRFTGDGIEHHVMVMDLPSAVGMSYGMPTSMFMELASHQTVDSPRVTLQLSIVGLSDIDRDGDCDVVIEYQRSEGGSGLPSPTPTLYSSSIRSFVSAGGNWAMELRDESQRPLKWIHWLGDMDGDGDDELIRFRPFLSPPRLGVQLEFAENISVP